MSREEAERAARTVMGALDDAGLEVVEYFWSDPTRLTEPVVFAFLVDALLKS